MRCDVSFKSLDALILDVFDVCSIGPVCGKV